MVRDTVLVYDPVLDQLVGELTDDGFVALAAVEEGEDHSEEEGKEEETVNPVLPTGQDIIWALIFFAALWAAMKFVLLPPIQKVRAERAQKIAAAKDAADNASADMGTAQADYDAAIGDARGQAAGLLEAARAEADAHRAGLITAAEADAAAMRAGAEADIAAARSTAIGTLSDDVAQVAAGAAGTVIGRPVDVAAARSAVDRALSGGQS